MHKEKPCFRCVYSCQTCLPCHIFFRSLRLLLQWRERALTVCLFFLVVRLYLRDWNVSFLLSISCTRRNSHKTKRDFFQQITHIFIIFFLSLQLDGVEIFHLLNCFFSLRQTRAPYLVITLRLPAILSKEYSVKKKEIFVYKDYRKQHHICSRKFLVGAFLDSTHTRWFFRVQWFVVGLWAHAFHSAHLCIAPWVALLSISSRVAGRSVPL